MRDAASRHLCLRHYRAHPLDQSRIAIHAARLQEMANFEHQPVNVRVASGEPIECESELECFFYVRRPLATGFWINEVCNGGGRPRRIDRILDRREIRCCQPVEWGACPGACSQDAMQDTSLLRCDTRSLAINPIEPAKRIADWNETVGKCVQKVEVSAS